jgi:hypothetical protein
MDREIRLLALRVTVKHYLSNAHDVTVDTAGHLVRGAEEMALVFGKYVATGEEP